jgi:hypothetical protein
MDRAERRFRSAIQRRNRNLIWNIFFNKPINPLVWWYRVKEPPAIGRWDCSKPLSCGCSKHRFGQPKIPKGMCYGVKVYLKGRKQNRYLKQCCNMIQDWDSDEVVTRLLNYPRS